MVDRLTKVSCILTDSMKSGGDCSCLVHNIRTEAYIDSDKTNLAYLVS